MANGLLTAGRSNLSSFSFNKECLRPHCRIIADSSVPPFLNGEMNGPVDDNFDLTQMPQPTVTEGLISNSPLLDQPCGVVVALSASIGEVR